MKKYSVWTLLVVALLTILTSCAQPEEAAETEGYSAPAASTETEWSDVAQYKKDPPYTIGWSINNAGISWRTEYIEEFNQHAKHYGDLIKETIILNADSDVNKQIADIEDLLAKGVDALIIDPQSPTALVPIVEKAYQTGIPVIIVNDNIETDQYTAFVSVDHFDFGKKGAEWLVEAMGGKGNLVILDGVAGMGVAIGRYEGAMSVISQYPEIKVVAREYTSWSYDQSKIAMQNVLAAQPQIDGIWSTGGDSTLGAVEAFQEAERDLVPMTGEALNGYVKKWIELEPEGFSSVAPYMPTWLSASALDMAVKALIGFPVPKNTVYPTPTFYEEDIESIVRYDLPDSYWLGSLLPDDVIKEIFEGQ